LFLPYASVLFVVVGECRRKAKAPDPSFHLDSDLKVCFILHIHCGGLDCRYSLYASLFEGLASAYYKFVWVGELLVFTVKVLEVVLMSACLFSLLRLSSFPTTI